MTSVTFTNVTLTSLLICRSTAGFAVIFGIVSLLFDLLVSFSVLITLTELEMFPTETTSVMMIICLQSYLAKSPIYQTPSSTS